jgi:hypothetical protein
MLTDYQSNSSSEHGDAVMKQRSASAAKPGFTWGEKVVGLGALAMATGAFLGHLLIPDKIADLYGWPRNRWYQREIGALNAGIGYGLISYARGHRTDAFLGSWSTSALLMAATRLAAIAGGYRRGKLNVAIAIEDAALGVGGFLLLRRERNRR